MKRSGQIALVPFAYAEHTAEKRRPVLLLSRVPGPYEDWLVAMISSRLHQAVRDFDEIVNESAS